MTHSKFVAFTRYGNLEIHAIDPQGKTDTLCGCDGNDSHPDVGTYPATLPDDPKITCEQCSILVRFCRRYGNRDFIKGLRG
jgi:hypothetical protein